MLKFQKSWSARRHLSQVRKYPKAMGLKPVDLKPSDAWVPSPAPHHPKIPMWFVCSVAWALRVLKAPKWFSVPLRSRILAVNIRYLSPTPRDPNFGGCKALGEWNAVSWRWAPGPRLAEWGYLSWEFAPLMKARRPLPPAPRHPHQGFWSPLPWFPSILLRNKAPGQSVLLFKTEAVSVLWCITLDKSKCDFRPWILNHYS